VTPFRVALRALPLAAAAACVAYDTAGPAVPSIDGTYATKITISYANYVELRRDSLTAWITLRDIHYRGRFEGTYRTPLGDSGLFAGAERPESTLVVNVFGAPPKPIAYVMAVRQFYPWCDFPRLGTGPLLGRLRGDSLLLDGQGAVPCFYQFAGTTVEIATTLQLHIVGIR
jgi:hypothetical protein